MVAGRRCSAELAVFFVYAERSLRTQGFGGYCVFFTFGGLVFLTFVLPIFDWRSLRPQCYGDLSNGHFFPGYVWRILRSQCTDQYDLERVSLAFGIYGHVLGWR